MAQDAARLPGHLDVLSGGDDQGAHGRAGCGDLRVGVRDVIAGRVDRHAQERQPGTLPRPGPLAGARRCHR